MKNLDKAALTCRIEERAAADLAEGRISGVAISVFQAGQELYRGFLGRQSPEGDAPLREDALFRLASMTKPITAVATMILVERGLLSLEDTVDRFYPAFTSMRVRMSDGVFEPTTRKITVRQILTHSSGIGSGEAWNDSLKIITDQDRSSVDAFVEFLSRQPLSFVPGTKAEYSGIGAFSVLTGMIQKITGMSYAEFLKKEIFDPCRMVDTAFEPTEEQWARLIVMHDRRDGTSVVGQTFEGCVFERIPASNYLGGAGLIASAEDYFRFAKMLLAGGIYEGNRVLTEASVAEISRPQFFKKASESWGLGVRVITDGSGVLPEGSYGWSGAYGTHFWIDPENEIIGIYMKNSRYDGGSGAVTSKHFERDVYVSLESAV